ncbi:MAG: twin-arginine translocation signal domain-containing protein [Saprospiraceae bacterium]|nr:twin-arginine translocation signal domain-containing protein [Saprospiraceae bacterium]MDW8228380.1 twin-arginine translocation signal domain-containing protein [Saprospiraceae bacterium]
MSKQMNRRRFLKNAALAAAWLALTPLSEASIATGSSPQLFPDFTSGRWMERKPNFAIGDEF